MKKCNHIWIFLGTNGMGRTDRIYCGKCGEYHSCYNFEEGMQKISKSWRKTL